MADKPSAFRNFLGRTWDRVTPGVSNYNTNTGQFSHTGSGVAQVSARLLGIMTGNPLIGTLASRGIGAYVNRADNAQGAVQQGSAPVSAGSVNPGYTGGVTMPSTTANLGLGAQPPGGSWNGYLQGQGSVNNFGSQGFTRPGYTNWSPSSRWGQQLTEQPAAQGSNLGFGNNVQGFAGGGGSSSGSSMSGNRMAGIVGGRLASDSMIDLQRRWANR